MKDVTRKDQWNEESVNEIEIIKVIEKFVNREDSTFEANIYIYIYIYIYIQFLAGSFKQ